MSAGTHTPRTRAGLRLALAVAAAALPACSGALYSEFVQRGGVLPGAAVQAAQAQQLQDKADVLARLGAPAEVRPLVDGDVFIYRASRTDVEVVDVNPGIFTGIFVPIYAQLDGRFGDDVLLVQFDEQGRVRSICGGGRRR